MSYATSKDLADDPTFVKQILVAIMNQCAAVFGEALATQGHKERVAFAAVVIKTPAAYTQPVAYATLTQSAIASATIAAPPADSVVQTAVAAVWNALAGYTPN